jgi:hypothetical protein
LIENKKQNFIAWRRGDFGNKLRAWKTIEEWRAANFVEPVALRYLGTSGGGRCVYNLLPEEVEAEYERWVVEYGMDPSCIMLNEMAPGKRTVIQGEFYNGVLLKSNGQPLVEPFFFSRHPTPMRTALKEAPENTHFVRARTLLKYFMTAPSWEDFEVLLGKYPDHVLEVSVFDRNVGDLPRRNAVVWEIRHY